MTDLARAVSQSGKETRPFRIGVITAYTTGSSTVQVNIDGSVVTLPCVLDSGYAVGRTALVATDGKANAYVIGVFGTAAGSYQPPDPSDTTPTVQQRIATLLPIDTGTYDSSAGHWRAVGGNITQGTASNYYGAAFYGSQVPALNADLTYPISATLTFTGAPETPATSAPTLALFTETTKGTGAPTQQQSATSPTFGPGVRVTWTLPTSWITALANGTAGSLGIHSASLSASTFVRILGINADPAAMALTVTYFA